jgi:hypothetical protein
MRAGALAVGGKGQRCVELERAVVLELAVSQTVHC